MRVPSSVASLHERFKNALTRRYFIRLNMKVVIALVLVLAGVFGRQADKRCPGAARLRQVPGQCVFKS